MRKGDFKLFYTPVVYNPETQSSEPIQNGGVGDAFLGLYGLIGGGATSATRDELKLSMVEPTVPMPLVTIDPMAIPIASFAVNVKDDGGLQNDDPRQGNLLKIIPNSGLIVEPYRDIVGKTVESDIYNRIVTVNNLKTMLKDCDGQPLDFPDENSPQKIVGLATCANIRALTQELRNVLSSILEIQNRLETLEERPYDGSGATTDIAEGNANPGPGDDSGLNVPYVIQTLTEVEERKEHTQITAVQYLQSTSLDSGKVYAIDFYRTRYIPQQSGQPLVEKEYHGTVYVRPNSFGQVSYRLGVATHASGVSGAMFGGGWVVKLVFRNLRQGEVATNVYTTPDA